MKPEMCIRLFRFVEDGKLTDQLHRIIAITQEEVITSTQFGGRADENGNDYSWLGTPEEFELCFCPV